MKIEKRARVRAILALWLVLFGVSRAIDEARIADAAAPSGVVRVLLMVPPVTGDTTDHADILAGASLPLAAVALDSAGARVLNRPVKWASGNAAVASVTTAGVVRGVKRGYATITATIDGKKATTRACVSAVARESLAAKPSGITVLPRVAQLGQPGARVQLTADVPWKVTGATAWGSCVHWWVDSLTARRASIDRSGVLHVMRGADRVTTLSVGAAIGPAVP